MLACALCQSWTMFFLRTEQLHWSNKLRLHIGELFAHPGLSSSNSSRRHWGASCLITTLCFFVMASCARLWAALFICHLICLYLQSGRIFLTAWISPSGSLIYLNDSWLLSLRLGRALHSLTPSRLVDESNQLLVEYLQDMLQLSPAPVIHCSLTISMQIGALCPWIPGNYTGTCITRFRTIGCVCIDLYPACWWRLPSHIMRPAPTPFRYSLFCGSLHRSFFFLCQSLQKLDPGVLFPANRYNSITPR
jgi:hypothetical protein